MRKYVLVVMVVLVCLSVTTLPVNAAPTEAWPSKIIVGSFPKESAGYPTTVAIARLLKYTPAQGVIREYPGGTPGLQALVKGDVDTWTVGQNDFYNAYLGEGFWKGKPQKNIRLLISTWFDAGTAFGVRPGEGIHSLQDLAGKRVMVKSLMPFYNNALELVLKKAGVWDKIKVVEWATFSEIVTAMVEKKVDAFCSTPEGSFALQIKQSTGLEWISTTEEEAEAGSRVPGNIVWIMPRWILEMYNYPPNKVIRGGFGYSNSVGVRSEMPDHVAYGILEALYGKNHLDEVRSLSPRLNGTDIKLAAKNFWLPFHSGAVRFYKDKGLWTAEMEAKQREFLAKGGLSK